jgi:hypothetical protein
MTTTSVQIGLLTITLDQQVKRDRDFLDGFVSGMECYYEQDLETRRASVPDLIENFDSISDEREDFVSTRTIARAWLVGFIMGWMTGLHHPDLAESPSHELLAGLTRKYRLLYQNLTPQTEEERESNEIESLPLAILQAV